MTLGIIKEREVFKMSEKEKDIELTEEMEKELSNGKGEE